MQTDAGVIGLVNLGNGGEFTMLGLAESVPKLTASHSVICLQLPEDGPKQPRTHTWIAKDLQGWCQKIGIEDGLRKIIEYYRGVVQ